MFHGNDWKWLHPSASVQQIPLTAGYCRGITFVGKCGSCRLVDFSLHGTRDKRKIRYMDQRFAAGASSAPEKKQVWIWTEKKEIMTAAVEIGWNTFIFRSHCRELAVDWSSIAMLCPLFIEDGNLFDCEHKKVASFMEISSPHQLQKLLSENDKDENVVAHFLDWQVISAENTVAAIQGTKKMVFAVSNTSSEAQTFFEALEQGLGGVVLKTEDTKVIFELKDYLDRRNEEGTVLELKKARVTKVQMAGMGDRVCVDLCSLMRPGEGLLVGSFARGLFLVHSECLESNYISSRPFRVNAGPVHAYVSIPMGKTSYLSELESGKEVIVVNQMGRQRTAVVGRTKIETRQLILIEAKGDQDNETYSIFLQNAETVALISAPEEDHKKCTAIPVTSLKIGDEILVRVQGSARHTGIEIQEFIIEK